MHSQTKTRATHIAYFISPHGFGHAARAAAVAQAVQAHDPTIHFDIFTTVPEWFFRQSLTGPFSFHSIVTDVGLVQRDMFVEDLPATIARLNALVPFRAEVVDRLAEAVLAANCACVICDIAPLGIAVARAAGIPSILVENFTWDWIYSGYIEVEPRLSPFIPFLADMFQSADFHIQTEPVCVPSRADLSTAPVSRPPRVARAKTRERFGIAENARVVLISMGGIPGDFAFLPLLASYPDILFIVPGVSETSTHAANALLLPHDNEFFHPDMIAAADVIIAKLGYSTVAEVYQSGLPLGFVGRSRFAESDIIRRFVMREMPSLEIQEGDFAGGAWLRRLAELLQLPPSVQAKPNGADQIADFILTRVG